MSSLCPSCREPLDYPSGDGCAAMTRHKERSDERTDKVTTAKRRLVKRLLEGSDDIFTEFVIVGLEDSLETIITEIERLLKIKNLSDQQWQDLTELCLDGQATVRVLRYYTAYEYTLETVTINKGIDKGKEWI